MAWAALIPVAIAAGSALMQYLNSQQAAGLSAEERKKLEYMAKQIQSPNFDPNKLTPEDYQIATKYVPEVAPYFEEAAPQTIKLESADALASKDAMRSSLAALQNRMNSDLERELIAQQGQQAAARQAQADSQTLLQEAATRGRSGSGLEFLSRILAAQKGQENAANVTAQAEIENQRAKLQAAKDALSAANMIRGNEYQQEAANTNIINEFNQRLTAGQRDWANNRANAMTEANRWNTTNAQDIANKNVAARNAYQTAERNRQDTNAQNQFENELARLRVATGQAGMAREDIAKNAQQTNTAISGAADAGIGAWGYITGNKQKEDETNPLKKRY